MMETKEKIAGVTFNGNVTFNGPMFDIHDNQQVTIVKQGPSPASSEKTTADSPVENPDRTCKRVNAEILSLVLQQCKAYIWAHAAYGITFCVCRDLYHMENNASQFERMLADGGIEIPEGTINSAMSRNPWMKFHIDKWDEYGVMERVLKLRDEFRLQMDKHVFSAKMTE